MIVDGLPIPDELLDLLAGGHWPCNGHQAQRQFLNSMVPAEVVRRIAEDETQLYLLSPPFRTVKARYEGGEHFWKWEMAVPDGIAFESSVVIADFGIGSDAPILLDYRFGPAQPRVLRLKYSRGGKSNAWILTAETFREFADKLELGKLNFLEMDAGSAAPANERGR